MNTKKYIIYRRIIENIIIVLIFFAALANIALSMPYASVFFSHIRHYYDMLTNHSIEIFSLFRRTVGFVMLFIIFGLYKRMQVAWVAIIITLTASLSVHFVRYRNFDNAFIFLELFIFITLLLFQDDFKRKSDRASVKKSIFVALSWCLLVLLNSSIGYMTSIEHYKGLTYFSDCVIQAVKSMFMMETNVSPTTRFGLIFSEINFIFNWTFIILAIIYVLKPLIYNPIISKRDKEMVFTLVKKYGQNPMAYLALEDDKKYFFGSDCEGVIAFAVATDVAVCCGDIITSDQQAPILLSEFMAFCRENNYSILLMNVTQRFLELYKTMGFGTIKYGEDACFLLSEYNLSGGRVSKVRAAINHANKAGITVEEYKPQQKRDFKLENKINEVSRNWLASKNCGELIFTLGSIGFDHPYEKRYFVAKDVNNKVLSFVVFIPYEGKQAYLADITRRVSNSPQGVIEKIVYDAFMVFKEEGVTWGSLGLVPLANIREKDTRPNLVTRIFEFVYENFNSFYGFKPLHHAKEKYAPTHWITRYFAYYPPTFSPSMAYAIAKVQNPRGMRDYVKFFISQRFKN